MASQTEWMKDFFLKGGKPSQIEMNSPTVGQQLNTYIGRRHITVTALAGLAVVNRASLYKIMNGSVKVNRNTLLRIALALELSFDETQELLKASGNATLTVRSVRDRYISQAIVRKYSIYDLNRQLISLELTGIYEKND